MQGMFSKAQHGADWPVDSHQFLARPLFPAVRCWKSFGFQHGDMRKRRM